MKNQTILYSTIRLLCLAFGIFSFTFLQGQVIPSKPVTLLDQNMGLISPFNYYIYKDSRSLVWICSISGLYQYNGKQIKVYKPDPEDAPVAEPQHVHSSFCEDANGDIWFATWRGIVCYERNKDKFKPYLLPNSNSAHRFSVCGLDSFHQLWFVHADAIYTLHILTGKFERRSDFNSSFGNAEFYADGLGNKIIFGYSRYKSFPGLMVYQFLHDSLINKIELFAPSRSDTLAISDIQMLTDSTFLIATSLGLYKFNLHSHCLEKFLQQQVDKWAVTAITPYKKDKFLIGTSTGDYFVFNPFDNLFTQRFQIHCKGEKLNNSPLSMYTDAEGAIWIYLHGRGVAYFLPDMQVFDFYPLRVNQKDKNGLLDVQNLIELDSANVLIIDPYIGAYFVRTIAGRPDQLIPCNQCPAAIRNAYRDAKGRIWMNSQSSIYVMDPQHRIEQIKRAHDERYGAAFCELNDGRIINFVPSNNLPLKILNHPNTSPLSFSNLTDIDSSYNFSYIKQLPNQLIYGSGSTLDSSQHLYLFAFDPAAHFKRVHQIPVPWGLRSTCEIAGRSELLIGTTSGPFLFDFLSGHYSSLDFTCCTEGTIWKIIPAQDQQFLIGGENCICLIDLNQQTGTSYNLENGLGMKGLTWMGGFRHTSGLIWVGQNTGIAIADPKNLSLPEYSSKVTIFSIRINDHLDFSFFSDTNQTRNPNEIREMKLPFKENTLSFEFGALSYAGVDEFEYEYHMNGIDDKWIDGGKQGFARYVNLAPGDYTFDVRVKNQPQSLHTILIGIIPPFYKTSWFLALILTTVVFFIIQLTRLWERQKQKRLKLKLEQQLAIESERLRISQDLHDDLGSGLSALSLRTKLLSDQINDLSYKTQFDELVQNTNRLTEQIRETIWTVNSKNDTIDILMTRLHQYAKEYFEGANMECSVELMTKESEATINGMHRREIYFAFKEALHNIVKHANASSILIRIKTEAEKELIIEIFDNGTGFDSTLQYKGLGITSMQKRLSRIGGTAQIMSTSQGTFVLFKYPFHSP